MWHSGKSAVSLGKSLLWVLLFGLLPLGVSGLLFFLTKRKSGWGICGSSWLCVLGVFWFVLICLHLWTLGPCTNVVLTVCSCKDRATVRHRPYPKEKKGEYIQLWSSRQPTKHQRSTSMWCWSPRTQHCKHRTTPVAGRRGAWHPRYCCEEPSGRWTQHS